MSEPTAEHLKVAQEWLSVHDGFCLRTDDLNRSGHTAELALAALLASTYTSGAQWMLEAVRESLRQYPDGGGDIEVMAEVKRLLASREQALRMAIDRIREHWPHIEVGIKGRTHDPGTPTCLRCTIEKEIADAGTV